MLAFFLKQPNLSARIVVKMLGNAGVFLKQPNLSARIGVKMLGNAGVFSEVTKPVSQDWGKDAGKCWRFF